MASFVQIWLNNCEFQNAAKKQNVFSLLIPYDDTVTIRITWSHGIFFGWKKEQKYFGKKKIKGKTILFVCLSKYIYDAK